MKRLLILLALPGCFSSWAITQASGGQRILDEDTNEARVPMPDVRERLRVGFRIAPRFAAAPVATSAAPGMQPMTPQPLQSEPEPFELECTSTQTASDAVYQTAYRYGGTFRKVAVVMFVLEAGAAAAIYFAGDREKPGTQLGAGLFAADALGTAALAMVPRKEIYRKEVRPVISTIRTDCPAGLVLEIAGETFPIDAAGRIGEAGELALDAWMQQPTGQVRLTYQDRTMDFMIGQAEICTWNRLRHQSQTLCPATWSSNQMVVTSLEVPMGTLTKAD